MNSSTVGVCPFGTPNPAEQTVVTIGNHLTTNVAHGDGLVVAPEGVDMKAGGPLPNMDDLS